MSVVFKSGLVALVAGVRTYFSANSVDARVTAGFRARDRILTQGPGNANRVVFTPSDDNGNGGRIIATQQPGPRFVGGSSPQTAEAMVRAIRDWQRVCLVSVWSHAASQSSLDEDVRDAEELEVSERLIEWTMRAINQAGGGYVEFGDVRWTVPAERSFGLEARIGITFRHPMFDVPADIVRPGFAISKDLEA